MSNTSDFDQFHDAQEDIDSDSEDDSSFQEAAEDNEETKSEPESENKTDPPQVSASEANSNLNDKILKMTETITAVL